MKNIIILLIFSFFTVTSFCQSVAQNNVPEKVKLKCNSLYPKAEKTQWKKEKSNYKAEVIEDQARLTLLIDSIGRLIETDIVTVTLPQEVKDYISRSYPGEKIITSEKIINTKGKVLYKVRVENDYLFFNEEKELIKKEN